MNVPKTLARRAHQRGAPLGYPARSSRAPTSSSACPAPGSSAADLQRMNKDPFVFAMANPTPEVSPEEAAPYARIIATGRSDYPNQINNVLAFPGIFRGALDVRADTITEAMKIAAAAGHRLRRRRRRAVRGLHRAERLQPRCDRRAARGGVP